MLLAYTIGSEPRPLDPGLLAPEVTYDDPCGYAGEARNKSHNLWN